MLGGVLVEILTLLGIEDLHSVLAAATTCRRFHALLYDDQQVWRGLALAAYDDPANSCAFPKPQQVDWQARVLARATVTEILMDSRNTLGEGSGPQTDLLRARSDVIGDTLLGLYFDMPAYPTKSRNATLLTQLVKREEFAFLAINRRRGKAYAVLDNLRRVLDGEMWAPEAAVEAESPWVNVFYLDSPKKLCCSTGLVDWSAVWAVASILLWQYASEEEDINVERVEQSFASPFVGVGIGSVDDWAGVSGEWYVAATRFEFFGPVAPLFEVGTWTVCQCSLQDTLDGLGSFMDRTPTAEEASALNPSVPFSAARAPIYFSGNNRSWMPLDQGRHEVDVYIRGMVRLSMDDPPAAVWTWVIEQRDAQMTCRIVQMPGRGNGFFGRWETPKVVNTGNRSDEGAMWMMRA
ncbi:hypothetical protein CspeluHIS016_0902020 [Cutaneotrichosporon spelunceum]|uniref:F-box domain-containing protein n=1 Tax=Cutaneotrichosporon spelunceum TaxID=1672016 RepID=A0AAD3U000_9TREE|nr:hypothetical protein CspeluHIS016_0902020 [Cutaneotrichosporon spelunceum]